jgi:hypothetical protein
MNDNIIPEEIKQKLNLEIKNVLCSNENKKANDLNIEIILNIQTSSSYHPSQKKAIQNYVNNNREKYNEYHRKRHKIRMENDPDYKAKFKERMRLNYQKKKQQQQNKDFSTFNI